MTQDSAGLAGRIERFIWGTPEAQRPRWQQQALRGVRTLLILGRDLAFGQLTLRAMSLVYTTLLSIVPLLALSFSVLKAFGVYQPDPAAAAEPARAAGRQGRRGGAAASSSSSRT